MALDAQAQGAIFLWLVVVPLVAAAALGLIALAAWAVL